MGANWTCSEESPGKWAVYFDRSTRFISLKSADDLSWLLRIHKTALAVGVFRWSNYSGAVMAELLEHEEAFEGAGIALGAFCPGSDVQMREIFPEFDPFAIPTEPVFFLLHNGVLTKTRFGRAPWDEILRWAQQAGAEGRGGK